MMQKIFLIILVSLLFEGCNITKNATADEVPQAKPGIKAENAKFYIETYEKNLGKEINPKVLRIKMEQLMPDNNLSVVYRIENANYIIKVFTNTFKQKKENHMCYSVLTGEIKIYDSLGRLVLIHKIKGISGKNLNYIKAGFDAYNNLADYMNSVFIPSLKDALK